MKIDNNTKIYIRNVKILEEMIINVSFKKYFQGMVEKVFGNQLNHRISFK